MSRRMKIYLSVIPVILIMLSMNLCCKKFKPNSDLSLFLTSDYDSTFFLTSFFLPRFSNDGSKIYFLSVFDNYQSEGFLPPDKGGNLYSINLDSSNLTLIKAGDKIRYYSIPQDGQKIFMLEDSILEVLNLDSAVLETLPISINTRGYNAYSGFDISSNGEWLYYQKGKEYRKFNQIIQKDTLLFKYEVSYFEFDLSPDDTLLLIGSGIRSHSNNAYFIIANVNNFSIREVELPYGYYPATSCFSPSSSNYILFPKRASSAVKNDLILFDISTGKIEPLNATMTEKYSALLYPSCSSDGEKIAFSGSTTMHSTSFEIWILNELSKK